MANKDFVVKNGIVVNTAFSANASGVYFSGNLLANSSQVNAASFTGTANNSSYLNNKAEGNLNVNNATTAYSKTEGNLNVNSALTANNSSYLNTKSEANLNVNSALTSNNSSYLNTKTEANLNVNNATTAYSKTEGNLNVNSALSSNNSSYLGGTAASGYQTTAGLNANVAAYLPTYSGNINAASHTVGTAFTANATMTNTVSLVVSTNTATIGTAMYVTAGGNVGIGTSNPTHKLETTNAKIADHLLNTTGIELSATSTGNRAAFIDFHGDDTYTDFSMRIIRNNTGANAPSSIQHRGTGELGFQTLDAAPISLYTNSAISAFISSNGNVGIGTTTPAAKLVVNGDLTVTGSGSRTLVATLEAGAVNCTSYQTTGGTSLAGNTTVCQLQVNGANTVVSNSSVTLLQVNSANALIANSSTTSVAVNGSTQLVINSTASVFNGTVADSVGTFRPLVSGTAVASTSNTVVDFTGIPSWAKRITVMFNGVSTSGSSMIQLQLITTSAVNTGYSSVCTSTAGSGSATQAITSGFNVSVTGAASDVVSGSAIITNLTGNTWVYQSCLAGQSANRNNTGGGGIALAATLTGVRITTVNGTDTFDAGSINIMYE